MVSSSRKAAQRQGDTKVGNRTFYGKPIVDSIVKRITRKRAVTHSYGTRHSKKASTKKASTKKPSTSTPRVRIGFPLRRSNCVYVKPQTVPVSSEQLKLDIQKIILDGLPPVGGFEDDDKRKPNYGSVLDLDTDDDESCGESEDELELHAQKLREFYDDEIQKSIQRSSKLIYVGKLTEDDLITIEDDDAQTILDDLDTIGGSDDEEDGYTTGSEEEEEDDEVQVVPGFALKHVSLENLHQTLVDLSLD